MTADNAKRLELLRSAPLNKWIAISEDGSKIVAVADTFGEVSELIDRIGLSAPTILRTPAEWAPLSV